MATLASAVVGSFLVASSANAALTLVTPCANSELTGVGGTITVTGCSGFFSGNLLGGSPAMIADAQTAIRMLPGESAFSGTGLGNFSVSSNPITFPETLTGTVVVGFHNGAAVGQPNGLGGEGTGFFEFTAPAGGITQLNLSVPGLSAAEIFVDGGIAVPEPATWALMLFGVGAVGAAIRFSRRTTLATA